MDRVRSITSICRMLSDERRNGNRGREDFVKGSSRRHSPTPVGSSLIISHPATVDSSEHSPAHSGSLGANFDTRCDRSAIRSSQCQFWPEEASPRELWTGR